MCTPIAFSNWVTNGTPGQHHPGDGRRESCHGVIVVGKPDVDHEYGVGPTTTEEPSEAWSISPGPVPHERVDADGQTIGHRALGGQHMDVGSLSAQRGGEMERVIRLGKWHRGKSARDDQNSHRSHSPRIKCESSRESLYRAPPGPDAGSPDASHELKRTHVVCSGSSSSAGRRRSGPILSSTSSGVCIQSQARRETSSELRGTPAARRYTARYALAVRSQSKSRTRR